ncbi:MAG: peptidyl-prolyl cis-trans isomerase [Pseudomonadota bacterium]
MYRLLITLFVLAYLIVACGPQRGVSYDIDNPDVVAIINDWQVPADSALAMQNAINRSQMQLHLRDVVKGVVENELIAEYALDRYGLDTLMGENRVAFDFDIVVRDQATAILRQYFEPDLLNAIATELPEGGLDAAVTQPFSLTSEKLQALTELQSMGELELTESQRERAADTVVLAFAFDGDDTRELTLLDLYDRQNIQGRDRIHKGDVDFLRQQAKQRVGTAFVHHWLRQNHPRGEAVIEAVERMARNKEIKEAYMQHVGLIEVLHANTSPALKAQAEAIPQQAISEYFKAHKADFERVERARGRHLRFADEAAAQAAYRALASGEDFDSVAEDFSEDTLVAGETGWIERSDKDAMWLQTLLFTQALGRPARPFRSPQTDGPDSVHWEVVIVDERETGYPSADSEGVRYQVSRLLAREEISQSFRVLRQTLFKNARIQLNPELLELDGDGHPLEGTGGEHSTPNKPFSAILQKGDHAGHGH